jgi:uncharacterized membrane protein
MAAFNDGRQRAESTYSRARQHMRELADSLKLKRAARLEVLRSAIDELPQVTSAQETAQNAKVTVESKLFDPPVRFKPAK